MNVGGETSLREEIVDVCRRLYLRGLIAGADGNVSARQADGTVVITPAGVAKGTLTPHDLVVVDADGRRVSGNLPPSSEIRMHIRIYRRRPEVHAVVHAHPPAATAFAVAGEDLMTPVLPEIVAEMGGVPLVPYATPGSDSLADRFDPFLPHHDAFLMANHGATTLGPTLAIAHRRMESLEHAARILLGARALGRVRPLSDAEAAAVRPGAASSRDTE